MAVPVGARRTVAAATHAKLARISPRVGRRCDVEIQIDVQQRIARASVRGNAVVEAPLAGDGDLGAEAASPVEAVDDGPVCSEGLRPGAEGMDVAGDGVGTEAA